MNRVRFLDKNVNINERENYSNWWYEQIQHYGTEVVYYINKTTKTNVDVVYGESPTAGFERKGKLILASNITNDSIILSKFGVQADCDMTAVIHISAFYQAFGPNTEPKSGDLIEMYEYGGFGDRPNGRGAPIYEITERDDQYLQMTNPLAGHYVWYLKCRRFEYSGEDGVVNEPNNNQLTDDGQYGKLDETFSNALTTVKTGTIDEFTSNLLYDYSKTDKDNPYGNY